MSDADKTSPYIDELSALYNRRYLQEKEAQKINAYAAHNIPFSLVIIDIDHFKEINDTYGHLKGDEIIKEFARFLRSTLRRTDTVIRYGGDEFICMMPRTLRTDAEWVYRRILKGVRERVFSGVQITLSVGIASFPGDGRDYESLFSVADQVLYDAKRSGRDRIGVARKKKLALPIRSFVNRDKELAVMQGLLVNSDKHITVGIVNGKVGVGKTHLCKEALNSIKGKEVIWSDCVYFTDAIAYYPLREALKYRIQRSGTDIFRDIAPAYKLELSKLIPELMAETVVEIDSVLDKYRLYEGFRKAIEVGDRPKVVVIDNIQWSDGESLDVLQYLVRSLKDMPIAFLFIYRIEEKSEMLESFFSLLQQEIEVTKIEVMPFEYADVHKSAELIIGDAPMEPLVEYVAKESGGIPFYIEEVMRELHDKKYLIIEEDQWIFREPDKEITPKNLADIAIRRYHSLSNEAQSVIDIASVIGWFDTAIIKTVTGYNEGEIAGLINDMNRLHMVKFTKDRYEFAEEISRNALYNLQAAGIQGKMLHQRIGALLEERYKDREHEILEELALHYYRARDKVKGSQYCVRAGDKAHEKYAHQCAIRYYTWALELLEDEATIDRMKLKIDCLDKRAQAFNMVGDSDRALTDADTVLAEARATGERKREVDALLTKMGIYLRLGRYTEVVDLAIQCKEISQEIGDSGSIAKALHAMAIGYKNLTDYETSLRLVEEALNMVRRTDNKAGEATVLNSQGVIYKSLGDYEHALKSYEHALKIARQIGSESLTRLCLGNIGSVKRSLGEFRSALTHYEEALTISTKIGDRRGEAVTYVNIGDLKNALGDYHDAVRALKSGIRIGTEIGYKTAQVAALTNLGLACLDLGEFDSALANCEEALSLARETQDKDALCAALASIAKVYIDIGDYDKARTLVEEALEIAQQYKLEYEESHALVVLSHLSIETGAHTDAKNFLSRIYASRVASRSPLVRGECLFAFAEFHLDRRNFRLFEKTLKDIGNLPEDTMTARYSTAISLLRGRYYTMTKDMEKAVHYFDKALAMFKKMGEMLNVGKTYYYLSIMESKRGKKTASKAYGKQALEIFDTIGAKAWKERAEKIIA